MKNILTKMYVFVALILVAGFATQVDAATKGNQPAFVNTWHGLGSDHQGDTNPGDTATQRHNFDQATAGKSGVNPAIK